MRPILLLVLVALLAACGRGAASPLPADQPPGANDADVAFLQAMIPHDQQAIDAARLATGRTRRPEVAKLAASITAGHAAEVSRMQALLTRWRRPGAADAGTSQHLALLPGMLAEGQLEWLQTLTGTRFDLGLLTMMRTHHAGAVELAETELRTGASAEAKGLARKVIDTRQPEIRRMQRWQDTWPRRAGAWSGELARTYLAALAGILVGRPVAAGRGGEVLAAIGLVAHPPGGLLPVVPPRWEELP